MVIIRTAVLGVGFDSLTMQEATSKAMSLIESKSGGYVVTPNPEIVMLCRENSELAEAVENAALVLADGIGIVKGAQILGTPLPQKLPGIDFAQELFGLMAQKQMSLYLLGGKPGIAEKAAETILSGYSGIKILGTGDGYFSDDTAVIEKINACSPDLLLVCLGAPKQELWMQKNAPQLKVGLMAGLGGSLDVFAGEVERAPEKWQRLGLEWFYRLLKEPSRIGRMAKLPLFVFAVFGQKLRGK
ncbi:MAG: WecB/TagA/CpsF family glycosyltransferase [Oscillospiraceae bacterium]